MDQTSSSSRSYGGLQRPRPRRRRSSTSSSAQQQKPRQPRGGRRPRQSPHRHDGQMKGCLGCWFKKISCKFQCGITTSLLRDSSDPEDSPASLSSRSPSPTLSLPPPLPPQARGVRAPRRSQKKNSVAEASPVGASPSTRAPAKKSLKTQGRKKRKRSPSPALTQASPAADFAEAFSPGRETAWGESPPVADPPSLPVTRGDE